MNNADHVSTDQLLTVFIFRVLLIGVDKRACESKNLVAPDQFNFKTWLRSHLHLSLLIHIFIDRCFGISINGVVHIKENVDPNIGNIKLVSAIQIISPHNYI